MAAYTLFYWPIPFRGQFVRAVLAHVHASWEERTYDDVLALGRTEPANQPVPLMGTPMLIDHATALSISQMPAILTYLGRTHGLLPEDARGEALTAKVVADANDVLYEMTRYNGAQQWTTASWKEFRPRLVRWLEIFEETGRRHGLTADTGTMLATAQPGLADLATYVLWHTMTTKLPALRPLLDSTAPAIAGLADRLADLPEQASLRRSSDEAYGNAWCGGQIEASLRAVL